MFRPFSIQIDWSVTSRIVALLVDAIDALSGDLHSYFLMRELSVRTGNATMRDTTFQSIWIENGQNMETIVFKVSKLPYLEVTDNMKNMTYHRTVNFNVTLIDIY